MAVMHEGLMGREHWGFRVPAMNLVERIRAGVSRLFYSPNVSETLLSRAEQKPDPTAEAQINATRAMFDELIKGQASGILPGRFVR